jgi:hypothetical protein
METGTQIKGIQFWYPEQTLRDPKAIIPYPATIQTSKTSSTQGVYLSCLTFYGEYLAMDFNAPRQHPCELMLFEHCYGYPLSGEFIRMDYCYDVPRILHCHVNPSNQRYIRGGFSRAVVDAVIAKKTFTYSINHTDNAQLMDLFTFGAYGGILLGNESYGQLTNFNFDCVAVGIHKKRKQHQESKLADRTGVHYCQLWRTCGGDSSDHCGGTGTHGIDEYRGLFRQQRRTDHSPAKPILGLHAGQG